MKNTHLVHPCTPHTRGKALENPGTPWGVRYTRLTCTDIAYLENKLSRSVGLFYRIRHFLSDNSLKSLYFSFVYSHLQFGIGAWGGVGITTLNQLNVYTTR